MYLFPGEYEITLIKNGGNDLRTSTNYRVGFQEIGLYDPPEYRSDIEVHQTINIDGEFMFDVCVDKKKNIWQSQRFVPSILMENQVKKYLAKVVIRILRKKVYNSQMWFDLTDDNYLLVDWALENKNNLFNKPAPVKKVGWFRRFYNWIEKKGDIKRFDPDKPHANLFIAWWERRAKESRANRIKNARVDDVDPKQLEAL